MLGHTIEPNIQLRLPTSIDPRSSFDLLVSISDTFDSITEYSSFPPVIILPDYTAVRNFIDFDNDTIRELLNRDDQNLRGQLIHSISDYLNQINDHNIRRATESINHKHK